MIRKFLFCLAVFSFNYALAAPPDWMQTIYPTLIAGSGHTSFRKTQNLWLATTPDPGLENTYSNNNPQNDTFLLGVALEKSFTMSSSTETAIGIEADYLNNSNITGVVYPMVNVAPDFDTLNYSYNMKSYLFQATAKFSKLNILPSLGAFFQVGAGYAINTLTDYSETSPSGSSASPMLQPFGNASHRNFAYSFGAGFIFQVSQSARLLVGYRYVNAGRSGFAVSPVQQTNNTLDFTPLTHQFIIVGLTF